MRVIRTLVFALLISTLFGCATPIPQLSNAGQPILKPIEYPITGNLERIMLVHKIEDLYKKTPWEAVLEKRYSGVEYSPNGSLIKVFEPINLPFDAGGISAKFGSTLATALDQAKVVSDDKARGITLLATVIKPDYPGGGLSFEVNIEILYQFIDTKTNTVIYQVLVPSRGSASYGSEFNGFVRRANAINMAYQNNIYSFVRAFRCCSIK